jgi:hypothetical protein
MTDKSASPGPSVVEIFVFMNEYNFRVEPGFAVVNRGDRLKFRNLTRFPLTISPAAWGSPITIGPDDGPSEPIPVPDRAAGFYAYSASLALDHGVTLEAIGGSGPGVIIRG